MSMSLGIGLGIGFQPELSAGSGGGGEYHAPAVHFDGANSALSIASLTASDSSFALISFWWKADVQPDYPGLPGVKDANIIIFDPLGNYAPSLAITNANNQLSPFFIDAPYNSTFGFSSADSSLNAWHHCLCAIDTNHTSGNKPRIIYIDDVMVSTTLNADGQDEFQSPYSGVRVNIGDDTYGGGFVGDLADFWYGCGQTAIVGGEIPEATRRLFISADGKPVDPATAIASLGAPTMLFSGDATTFGNNQGPGGTFTMTGVTNASTSPSD